jgi:enoyl-CoA hydratase/carnithine racemase
MPRRGCRPRFYLSQATATVRFIHTIPTKVTCCMMHVQEACTIFESCSKPTIAAIHGACVGAGMDITTACDIRICDTAATFCVKEIDLAITADMGTLQRLPRLIGEGAPYRGSRKGTIACRKRGKTIFYNWPICLKEREKRCFGPINGLLSSE